jgi:hypothetical protein
VCWRWVWVPTPPPICKGIRAESGRGENGRVQEFHWGPLDDCTFDGSARPTMFTPPFRCVH